METIPDKHMVRFIKDMLSFQLHTSNGQHSTIRKLKNGVPQGSVLAPMLFNIYIHDLPATQSRKYGYADDLAILLSSEDMNTLSLYLKNWRLKLSVGKTTSPMFQLNTREAAREMSVMVDNAWLQFQSVPAYLSVKLDRR